MSGHTFATIQTPDHIPLRRAILSVSDKTGIIDFARALVSHGCEIISTGGTASTLTGAGLPVTPIERLTNFPEMMDGRVKTLHPMVHGGLLAVRDNPAHAEAMREHTIRAIDLVCVNLYPFEETVSKAGCTRADAVEQIDIGGPSMIRSGAKNHAYVCVVTSPDQYGEVLEELRTHSGATTLATRRKLARRAFATTARYDAAIARYFAEHDGQSTVDSCLPAHMDFSLQRVASLRYGENPHQRGALYRAAGAQAHTGHSIVGARQLHGKELSYNNILDGAAALDLAHALARVDTSRAGACVVKHTNPCGAALAGDLRDAVEGAIAGDPIAAYGGILACNRRLDAHAAEQIARKERFFEVVIAPEFDDDALELLRARWVNVRLLASGNEPFTSSREHRLEFRSITGGVLVQDRDTLLTPRDHFQHAAGPAPSDAQLRAAMFLEPVARSLLSNAVVVGGLEAGVMLRMFGAGAGQMDRVTSCRIAVEKAGTHALGAVAFSDAFFPFADGPRVLIDAGITTIIHPGGSKRDAETVELCNQRGVTCLLTGSRHFRH